MVRQWGGVKQGRFVIFAFSFILQYLGVAEYPEPGKTAGKCHCAQMVVETRT